jgi:hypothetical protein
MEIHETADGGIEFIIEGSAPNPERSIKFVPNDDGTFDVTGRGPNGEKTNTIDPGGGSTALGQ